MFFVKKLIHPMNTGAATTQKKSTKDKILETALTLFNNNGVEAVTVRHIAQYIGISHSNVCYHFPRKEDIIFTLYNQVVDGMSTQIAMVNNTPETPFGIGFVMESMRVSFTIQYRYRFLILRRMPEIGVAFREIYTVRCEQFRFLLKALQAAHLLRSDLLTEHYDQLIRLMFVYGNFWMSEGEITYQGSEDKKLDFFIRLGWSMLVPYLTLEGQREYEAHLAHVVA
jgi:AcrR family transcriptional regulator